MGKKNPLISEGTFFHYYLDNSGGS